MRNILGLDIGVNSVGFGLVEVTESPDTSSIVTSGVRIVNEDPDFHGKFYTGNSASKNAGRTTKRMIRRLNNRYKHRRNQLVEVLEEYNLMPDEDLLLRPTALELYTLRHKAANERLELQELGRVLYHLNQKRGFLSNRKSQSNEESNSEYLHKIQALEGLVQNTTIGSFFYRQLLNNPFTRIKENIFPRASYIKEFDTIWKIQKQFYPAILTGGPGESNKETLYQLIRNEIIYYQRPLKSQKHLVSFCRFEPLKKVAPKSSPLFQFFRIWQQINNLQAKSLDNEVFLPTDAQKQKLFDALHNPRLLSARGTLAYTKILKLMELPRDFFLNFNLLEGNKTYLTLYHALKEAGIENPESFLSFDYLNEEEKGGLWQLWHITYSLPTENDVVNALQKHFPFSNGQAVIIASKTGYTADYGNLSAKAIRKILTGLLKGLHYDKACKEVSYDHTDDIGLDSDRELVDKLPLINPNTLHNPVVEQILNQVINVVNCISEKYGKPDEIRIELARELKSNAKQRQRMTKTNRSLRQKNDNITQRLLKEYGFKRVNARDLLRYRLWEETEQICLYSGKPIQFIDLYNGQADIEHVIPKSRSFSNSMSNYIVAFTKENRVKGQHTAYDYMKNKGDQAFKDYVDRVNRLYHEEKITKIKRDNLLCPGCDIPSDFIERQKKDTQYISREAVKMLKGFCRKITTTTGSVTDFLREKWQLKHLMEEINLDKYRAIGQTEQRTIKDEEGNEKQIEVITNFTKRDDHRHHAVDALIVALTNQSIIQKLNNLNQEFETYNALKQSAFSFPKPLPHLREKVKRELENILISFKKPTSKVLTKKINRVKTADGIKEQETWVPRGALHEDTVMGKIRWYKKLPLNKKFTQLDLVVNEDLKNILQERLQQFNNDPKKAFDKLEANPVLFRNVPITEIVLWDERFTKRVPVSENITAPQISKIVDKKVKELVEERVNAAGGIKQAFREYEKNPLYLNDEKKNPVKNVTVFDEGNLVQVRNGYVYTKGNHHSVIYTDDNGNFKDKVVPFWEAVEHCMHNLKTSGTIYPIINKSPTEDGWKFHTSLQINDLFVIGVDPNEIDFFDAKNRSLIARNIFRVQKISKGDYFFRHQYETTVDRNEPFAMKRIRSAKELEKLTKIRLNHIGEILEVEKHSL